VKDGGDVVGVGKFSCPNQAWQQGLNVVVVGFCSAEFGGESSENVRGDHVFCVVVAETRCADQGGPAIVLGGCGDGLVFGGELCDRSPGLLFSGDGLMGGEFRTDVLQDPEQEASRG
jgi:hypothetical protein